MTSCEKEEIRQEIKERFKHFEEESWLPEVETPMYFKKWKPFGHLLSILLSSTIVVTFLTGIYVLFYCKGLPIGIDIPIFEGYPLVNKIKDMLFFIFSNVLVYSIFLSIVDEDESLASEIKRFISLRCPICNKPLKHVSATVRAINEQNIDWVGHAFFCKRCGHKKFELIKRVWSAFAE